jgi:hypothetical protein
VDREREFALSPYLAQLGIGAPELVPEEQIPVSLPVARGFLPLDPWEHRTLQQFRGGKDDEGRPWPVLLAEGVAFRAKCLDRCAPPDEDESSSPREEDPEPGESLITEAAVGIALLQELQWSIDGLIRQGDFMVAKRLTGFRNTVGQSLASLRNLIGNDAFARAMERSPELLVSVPTGDAVPAEEAPVKRATARYRQRRASGRIIVRRRRRGTARIRFLLALLTASALAWSIQLALTSR